MKRYFYSQTISDFLKEPVENIIGHLSSNSEFNDELTQKRAWREQIEILKKELQDYDGAIYFEYSIPRMGERIDVVLIIRDVIFVLEFKTGEKEFVSSNIDQVWNYALDLKNFHETSQQNLIAPILIATAANDVDIHPEFTAHDDRLLRPIKSSKRQLVEVIQSVFKWSNGGKLNHQAWEQGIYSPTPTIIEAALALFNNHSVTEISRSDASARNLRQTSKAISEIINHSKNSGEKAICFVTGVPGAGKTLVGLDVATKSFERDKEIRSVFLSGNGPLVAILREALARDRVSKEKKKGKKVKKVDVMSKVKLLIQNVHHYRDEYLREVTKAPFDHVAIFDEAQRAWNHEQTANFMKRKKDTPDFAFSEPEFLISCLDRHKDWAVIVCLVGGGQEINTGEAGISEWIYSMDRSFKDWKIYLSSKLRDDEFAADKALDQIAGNPNIHERDDLHLSVSLRSFRAENLASFVKNLLNINLFEAKEDYSKLKKKYPIVLTRDLDKAKEWLRQMARGTERYGILVSSQAQRLKPHAIDVKSPMDPIHWFLDGKEDVRSSYYLEDVATEFHVQGLELDWGCVTWDGDLRFGNGKWDTFEFRGSKWQRIKKEERKQYLKNAYRVLLTRARQGMVIVVPNGDLDDPTRHPNYYDQTYSFLKEIGLKEI